MLIAGSHEDAVISFSNCAFRHRRCIEDEFINGGAQLRDIAVSADAVVSGKGRKLLFFKVLAPNLSRAVRSKVKGGGKLREVDVGVSIHRLVGL